MNGCKVVWEVVTMKGKDAMTYPWSQRVHVLGGERCGHLCSSYINELNIFPSPNFSFLFSRMPTV